MTPRTADRILAGLVLVAGVVFLAGVLGFAHWLLGGR